MLTACYLNNMTYQFGADGIPIMLLTGQTPDLSHLKIFVCPAYVHIQASQRRKMDSICRCHGGLLNGHLRLPGV